MNSKRFGLKKLAYLGVISWLVLWTTQLAAKEAISHLEPPFWWSGMQDQSLQLLVHGDNIAGSEVYMAYPGVTLLSVETVENANYVFLNLELSKKIKAGTFSIDFRREGELYASYQYELKSRREGSSQRKGFSPADVIYLITPDRFANGDTSNDSVEGLKESVNRTLKGGRHGGDIRGIIEHLDYLGDMGFTQLWLMPVLQNDMQDYSYHGYSTTDFYQVDKRFGDNELYAQLSRDGAAKGIGLIKDMILNHIGLEHWWMKDLPSKDWINNDGKFKETSHRREALHDPYGTVEDIKAFSDGWFVPSMPDMNQRNPLLAKYLIQNAIWWVEYADLSGIRVDTYSYSDKTFLSEWTRRIMEEYPNLNVVGEEWTTNPAIVAYWQKGSTRHNDYESELPSVMDFPLQDKLVKGLKNEETWATGLRELYETIASDFLYGDPYNLTIFADNHDMSRIFTQLDEDEALFKMAMTYFLTTRGIPQIFYGTEILLKNPGTDDHGIIRSDFPGGWKSDTISGFTGVGLSQQQINAQDFLKKLLNWRKKSKAVTQGSLTHYAPENGVYVYFRSHADQRIMVVLNKNDEEVTLLPERFKAMLGGFSQGADILSGKTMNLNKNIPIHAKSAMVFELN